ncbi:MAG: hypothetical protein HY319_32880 [Armatimonadetes bacterium]|nr:hypothetical protein [Armatimonadota bacterium]
MKDLVEEFRARVFRAYPKRRMEVRYVGTRERGSEKPHFLVDVLVLVDVPPDPEMESKIYDLAYDLSSETDFETLIAPTILPMGADPPRSALELSQAEWDTTADRRRLLQRKPEEPSAPG